ncbi:MAG: hypothetical protein VX738_12165 [Planctomycetota bacterium]|nr:hypothetical protein [Planctomycetota bacterium]
MNPLPVVNEEDPAENNNSITNVKLPVAAQGAIGVQGDMDQYSFIAQANELIVIECWAYRIDSTLRSQLEVYGPDGQKVPAGKMLFGTDSMLTIRVPVSGKYTVRLSDLVYSGSPSAIYRLEMHSLPRVLFTLPAVITEGDSQELRAFGYNLGGQASVGTSLESRSVAVSGKELTPGFRLPVFADAISVTATAMPLSILQAIHPVGLSLTEDPIVVGDQQNVEINKALPVQIPTDISGQLPAAQDRHWYKLKLHAGEVIRVDAVGSRAGSPVDLAVHVFSPDGKKQLKVFNDEPFNIGGVRFPSAHFDPGGIFTASKNGTYYLVVRDRIGTTTVDSRRIYRLRVTRHQPDITVVAIGTQAATPSGVTVRPGGHAAIHLLATANSALSQPVCVSATGLPAGVSCEDVWIGPGVRQVPMTIYATQAAPHWVGTIELTASFDFGGEIVTRKVLAGTMTRTGTASGIGRRDSHLAFSVTGKAPVTCTASMDRERYQQGSIIDLNITMDRLEGQPDAQVQLRGESLPSEIVNRLTTIPAGQSQGVVSFYIPEHMPPGRYTIAAKARTTHRYPIDAALGTTKEETTEIFSNAVSFEVYPAPFLLKINLEAPTKIKRGQVIQLPYSCIRNNQFIGKIHTELRAPGGVVGIRGRGVTFVGQTETGVIQIVANEDAPLGKQSGLRLEALGTVEDEDVHLGSAFLDLEIVE